MFVGREQELKELTEAYESGRFQALILYGRRRIGKTFLINRFTMGKPHISFTAQEANDKMNLALFSDKVLSFFGLKESGITFDSWNAALDFIADRAAKEPFILAFDEFPYACSANKGLGSIFQNAIDSRLKDSKLFLILCGSQISFMEKEVLGYKSPLFGRRTMQINLKGFDYYDAAQMLRSFSHEDIIRLYSCIGGTPHYLAQVDGKQSFWQNIKRLYFRNSGYLYNEPYMLLQQELREPAMYNSVIAAIAGGASRLNEIVTRTGEEKTKVAKYLRTLTDLRIVRRVCPFGEKPEKSRKSIYRIEDACYQFWYRFVFGNQSEIDSGLGELLADQMVTEEALSGFIGKPAFEEMCLDWMKRLNLQQKLPFLACSFGKWWGNDPVKKEETDLDLVLGDKENRIGIIGECKWRNEPAGRKDIADWMDKEYLLPFFRQRYYVFFSKSGYTEAAKELEGEKNNLRLVSLDDLFSVPEEALFPQNV